ncbi:MAG TPA: ribosome maturation factor RimM [Ktedonobacteraceae bacterium]
MPESQKTEWATIGQVVALFGVRGELKVRLFTDIPDRFVRLEAVHLDSDYRRLEIERVRPHKGELVVLKLRGIDNVQAAEALCHQRLLIPASQLAQLPPGRYYQHDILGLAVCLPDGRELGRIVDILQTGSNDVYVVREPSGKQVLIPAIREVVRQVDLIHHTMSIDPLPGLLEPAGREDEDEEEQSQMVSREEDS